MTFLNFDGFLFEFYDIVSTAPNSFIRLFVV